MRYFIELSYNGTNYHGWQKQLNSNSVQEELTKCISILLKEEVEIIAAGRTDSGVHAEQMFAHFDFEGDFETEILLTKLNGFLPNEISVHQIFKVDDNANARFDAISRTYQYYITNEKSPFNKNIYLHYKTLDIDAMNLACKYLLGKQDFTSFSKLHTQTHTNDCDVMMANWQQQENELIFTIKADRFLRNMVRAIVGTLLEVGEEKIIAEKIKEIIAKKDSSEAGVSVPAHALFLTKIEYPEKIIK